MESLHDGKLDFALKQLLNAEKILRKKNTPKNSGLWGITLNNIGCVYKKAKNYKGALHYLNKALDMEARDACDITNVSSTHLNISAILSSMGDHQTSLAHALASLKTLQSITSKNSNYVVSIVISYHSIGIENEYLKRYNEASLAYKKGWEIAEKELGSSHKLTESLKKSYVKSTSVTTMPLIRPVKKKSMQKKTSDGNKDFFSVLSSASSRKKTFYSQPKYTPVNKSFDDPSDRYNLYTAKVKASLSPITTYSKYNYAAELDTINKLINELDGHPKKKIKVVKSKFNKKYLKPTITIQRYWRGYLARKAFKDIKKSRGSLEFLQRKISDTKKHALTNGKILRPIPEIKVESKLDAIVLIQSFFRMCRMRNRFLNMKEAAVKIQNFVKSRNVRKLFLLITDAVVFIQSVYRGFRVRNQLKCINN